MKVTLRSAMPQSIRSQTFFAESADPGQQRRNEAANVVGRVDVARSQADTEPFAGVGHQRMEARHVVVPVVPPSDASPLGVLLCSGSSPPVGTGGRRGARHHQLHQRVGHEVRLAMVQQAPERLRHAEPLRHLAEQQRVAWTSPTRSFTRKHPMAGRTAVGRKTNVSPTESLTTQ